MIRPPMTSTTLPCAVARIATLSRAAVASNASPASAIETNRESDHTHHSRERPRDPGFVTAVGSQQPTHYERHRHRVQIQHGVSLLSSGGCASTTPPATCLTASLPRHIAND